MALTNKDKNDFKDECRKLAGIFDEKYDFIKLLEDNDSEYKVRKAIQAFLDSTQVYDLIYKLMPSLVDLNIDCGVISIIDVTKFWSGRHGALNHVLSIGGDDKWEKRLGPQNAGKSWIELQKELEGRKKDRKSGKEDARVKDRYLKEKNFASVLLSPIRLEEILKENKNVPCFVSVHGSKDGYLGKIKDDSEDEPNNSKLMNDGNPNNLKLINEDDHPQLISLISKDAKPLGFLQLKLVDCQFKVEENEVKEFENSEGIVFYRHEVVKEFSFLAKSLCDILLARVLARLHAVIEYFKNIDEKDKYFPINFRQAVGLDKNGHFDLYKDSYWKTELREIQDCFNHGTVKATDLTMEIISEFWKDVRGIKKLGLEDRFKAEETLFLINKYRDHFVHTLKVFLIGEKIIAELRKKSNAKSLNLTQYFNEFNPVPVPKPKPEDYKEPVEFQKFEYLWMLASTVHDWAYPVEEISKVLEHYWDKFFFGANFAEEYFKGEKHGKAVLESYARSVFTDHALGHDASTCFNHMLHDYKNKQHNDTIKNLTDFRDKSRNLSYTQEVIRYITLNRDHGIASALWYLGLSFECKRCKHYKLDCFYYDKKEGGCRVNGMKDNKDCDKFSREKKVCVAKCSNVINEYFCGNIPEMEINKHFKVAHAVYNHNMATKNEIKTIVDFKKNPLTFLLLLSDNLQDEGRPVGGDGKKVPDRPVGYIEKISFENNKLVIDVSYKWKMPADLCSIKPSGSDGLIVLGTKECKNTFFTKTRICEQKKGIAPCDLECEKVISSLKHLSKLKNAMTGLNVDINAKWKKTAWDGKWATQDPSLDIPNLMKKECHTIKIR
ncbi:MAG: hypothetical protein K9L30_17730 [Desulfobacterales bacterium]|nr:hypothetical protein [Desulfobacterales bacterium]